MALKDVKGDSNGSVDVSNISQDDEYEMVKKLLEYRQSCGMWSPKARAAMVIMCCKDLSDTLVQSLGFSSLTTLYSDANLTSAQADNYKYDFLGTSRD